MASLPVLKSGASLQYPATRTVRYRTFISRFLDGSEQRFRQAASPALEWNSSLALLDRAEAVAAETFFESGQGSYGAVHTMTDPWDGSTQAEVRHAVDEMEITQTAEDAFRLNVRLEKEGG